MYPASQSELSRLPQPIRDAMLHGIRERSDDGDGGFRVEAPGCTPVWVQHSPRRLAIAPTHRPVAASRPAPRTTPVARAAAPAPRRVPAPAARPAAPRRSELASMIDELGAIARRGGPGAPAALEGLRKIARLDASPAANDGPRLSASRRAQMAQVMNLSRETGPVVMETPHKQIFGAADAPQRMVAGAVDPDEQKRTMARVMRTERDEPARVVNEPCRQTFGGSR